MMSYVMHTKYVSQEGQYTLSDLQKNILLIICKTGETDYDTLERELKRTRTTIVQSLDPLRKYHYVKAQQVNPGIERSKLLFSLTGKGLCYSIAYLHVELDIITSNLEGEEEMNECSDFIKSIPDYNARREFIFETSKLIMKYYPFDDNGEFVVHKFEDIIGLGIRYGIIESAKEGRNIMDDEALDQLANILHPVELKKVQEFCLCMRNNMDSIINKLSKDATQK